MNATKFSLLITLYAILVKGKVHYAVPRPVTLLELLAQFHKIEIRQRWLFQCLEDLGDAGYITRQPRWILMDENEIRRLPALLALTTRGVKYLSSKMVEGSRKLYHQMLSWLQRADARFPKPKDIIKPEEISDHAGGVTHLREIIKALI